MSRFWYRLKLVWQVFVNLSIPEGFDPLQDGLCLLHVNHRSVQSCAAVIGTVVPPFVTSAKARKWSSAVRRAIYEWLRWHSLRWRDRSDLYQGFFGRMRARLLSMKRRPQIQAEAALRDPFSFGGWPYADDEIRAREKTSEGTEFSPAV